MQPTRLPDSFSSHSPVGHEATVRSMLMCLALFLVLIGGISLVKDDQTALAQGKPDADGPVRLTPLEGLQRVGAWATDGGHLASPDAARQTRPSDDRTLGESLWHVGSWAVSVQSAPDVTTYVEDADILESLRRIGSWTTDSTP